MHISDGILPAAVSIGSFVITGGVTAFRASKIKTEKIPKIATVTSALFIASLFHIKLGPTSVHPMLSGIGALILGPDVFIASLVALFFQAVMFNHGGITALGANTIIIGGSAFIVSLIFPYVIGKVKSRTLTLALYFLAGFLALLLSLLLASITLIMSNSQFLDTINLFVIFNLPLAFIEGILTLVVIEFVKKIKPDLLYFYNNEAI